MGFMHAFNSEDKRAGRYEITGFVLRQTEKAIHFDDGTGARWLPKKHIRCENLADGSVIVDMPRWLAEEKRYV